ncbi:GL25754 [Drosophila persimilis]|uniref:GL25754 n=1 Tax=Drosophila persimilis TaxID=7234 RepID=B4GK32_DROPE|nr:GL25754 [Drosophila persimilis]
MPHAPCLMPLSTAHNPYSCLAIFVLGGSGSGSSSSSSATLLSLSQLPKSLFFRCKKLPSHQAIKGNEAAGVLAKEGVGLANGRTENVPLSLRTLQSDLEKQARSQNESRWRTTTTYRTSKILCKERNEKLSHHLLHLPRKDCRLLVGILTGHCLVILAYGGPR